MQEQVWLTIVKEELAARRKDNPRYSIRTFAGHIGVAPSTLSSILSGQRRMTPRTAMKFAERCGFSAEKKILFLNSAVGEGVSTPATNKSDKDFRVLTEQELERVAHWQHYAILSLAQLPSCRSDAAWVSRRLNIPEDVATTAIRDLLDLGLIAVRSGTLHRRTKSTRTKSDVPQAHVRRIHAELMHKGLKSLERDPVTSRDITAVTMGVNSRRLKGAKRKIKEFRRYLMDFLSEGPRDAVYAMQISLFPLVGSDGSTGAE